MGAEGHVLGRRRHDRGHELPIAGQVRDWDLLLGQDVQYLGRDLDIAEDDYLPDGSHRDPVCLPAVDRDDQVLGAAADVGAWPLKIEHGLLVIHGDDGVSSTPAISSHSESSACGFGSGSGPVC